MRLRNTLILLVIFAALGAYVYFTESPAKTPTPTPAPQEQVLNLVADDVVGLSVQGSGDRETRLKRQRNQPWRLEAPLQDQADEARVQSIVSRLAQLTPTRTLTQTTETLSAFGLVTPTLTVTLQLEQREEMLFIGAQNPQQTAYYAQRRGDSAIHLILAGLVDELRQLLTKPPVKPTPTPTPTITPTPLPATPTPIVTATPVPTP